MTPADVQPEDPDAFEEGVLAGQNSAISGIPLSRTCVNLNAEGGIGPHLALETPEAVTWIMDVAEGLAAGIAGSILFFINLSIALETFTDDPGQRLTEAGGALQREIQDMGFEDSMQMYIGGGVDTNVAGCELILTRIFATQDAAVTSAQALGRAKWLVASWRSDQSGGATVVATSE